MKIRILAIGGSVTAGSNGFSARHPDSLKSLNDSYPKILEDYINDNFPCTQSLDSKPKMHTVVNVAVPGCSASCHLSRWIENYAVFSETKWDLIIIEPTANTEVRETNHLRALIAAFEFVSFYNPSILLLSASFRLPFFNNTAVHPDSYQQLPDIEGAVSYLAEQWRIPFVSFPKYVFENNLYNSSNHHGWCIEARCNFWLDGVHITKTAHTAIARLLENAISSNTSHLSLPLPPNISQTTLPTEVEALMPSTPEVWISFRTETLPILDDNLICMKRFQPNNSRGRLSTMFVYDMANHNNETSNAEYHNASFVLKVPSSQRCKDRTNRFQVEYLHSYTTPGVAELLKWKGGDEHINSSLAQMCEEEDNKHIGWELVDSFNASNSEKISVSGSKMFDIDAGTSYIKLLVYGGDYHMLSVGYYC
jgi:hypothetical protein